MYISYRVKQAVLLRQDWQTSLSVIIHLVCLWSSRCLFLHIIQARCHLVVGSSRGNWRLVIIPADSSVITHRHPTSTNQWWIQHGLHVTWHVVWHRIFFQSRRDAEWNSRHIVIDGRACITANKHRRKRLVASNWQCHSDRTQAQSIQRKVKLIKC